MKRFAVIVLSSLLFFLVWPMTVHSIAFPFKVNPQICDKNCAEWGVERIKNAHGSYTLEPVIYAILKIAVRSSKGDSYQKRFEKISDLQKAVPNLHFVELSPEDERKINGDHIGMIVYLNSVTLRPIRCADVFDNNFGKDTQIDQSQQSLLEEHDSSQIRYNVKPYRDENCILTSYKDVDNSEISGYVELYVPSNS